MTAPTKTRRTARAARPTFEVLELRQAWHIKDGRYYREAAARRSDGALRLILIPDGPAPVAA